MPQLGYDMVEGAVQTWLKKEGDRVEKGEVIAEIETDKSSVELEAFASGVLRKIVVDTGKTVPVNTVIAVIGGVDEQINWAEFGVDGASADATPATVAIPAETAKVPVVGETLPTKELEAPLPATVNVTASFHEAVAATLPASTPTIIPADVSFHSNMNSVGANTAISGRVMASPLARRVAGDLGVDIAQISGTGPGGRVKKRDVEMFYSNTGAATTAPAINAPMPTPVSAPAAVATPQPAPVPQTIAAEYEEIELSRMRQTIARRTTEAKQQMPHIYITNEIDMGEALKLRQQINAALEKEGLKVSVNDLVIKAVAKALQKFPALNSSYQGTKLRLYKDINVAFAVATEGGLITPVIRHAEQKSVSQIAKEAHNLADKARKGNLHPDDYNGGTFSISNLGMYDVSHFVAVINQPQAAILAVAATKPQVVVVGGNEEEGYQFGVRQEMAVTISVDHRATDGAVAAQFLQELKTILQNPFGLLV
jgi:pyruvate dehydrogenase E2 component (dihydrolipoamide acetyltransferase)